MIAGKIAGIDLRGNEMPQLARLVFVAIVAGVIGFVIGFYFGRQDEPTSPQLPCPTCRLEPTKIQGVCRLVGQADSSWMPLSSFAGELELSLEPEGCFEFSIPCPSPEVRRPHQQVVGDSWCIGNCSETGTRICP